MLEFIAGFVAAAAVGAAVVFLRERDRAQERAVEAAHRRAAADIYDGQVRQLVSEKVDLLNRVMSRDYREFATFTRPSEGPKKVRALTNAEEKIYAETGKLPER